MALLVLCTQRHLQSTPGKLFFQTFSHSLSLSEERHKRIRQTCIPRNQSSQNTGIRKPLPPPILHPLPFAKFRPYMKHVFKMRTTQGSSFIFSAVQANTLLMLNNQNGIFCKSTFSHDFRGKRAILTRPFTCFKANFCFKIKENLILL